MSTPFDFSKFAVGGATRPDTFTGMQPEFSAALARMFESAPPNVRDNLRVSSGFRSPERQGELFDAAVAKYGSPEAARKWVAPPGHSQHNRGDAADLKFLDPAALAWAHQNAGQYGLAFPLSNENWHVELAGARGGQPAPALPTPPGSTPAAADVPPARGLNGDAAQPFGDLVAPQQAAAAAPDFGSIIANFAARKRQEAEAAQAEQQRREALFGGSLLG